MADHDAWELGRVVLKNFEGYVALRRRSGVMNNDHLVLAGGGENGTQLFRTRHVIGVNFITGVLQQTRNLRCFGGRFADV
jgi:hypothetical protein